MAMDLFSSFHNGWGKEELRNWSTFAYLSVRSCFSRGHKTENQKEGCHTEERLSHLGGTEENQRREAFDIKKKIRLMPEANVLNQSLSSSIPRRQDPRGYLLESFNELYAFPTSELA